MPPDASTCCLLIQPVSSASSAATEVGFDGTGGLPRRVLVFMEWLQEIMTPYLGAPSL